MLGSYNNNFWSIFPAISDVDMGNQSIKNLKLAGVSSISTAKIGNPDGSLLLTSNIDMGLNTLIGNVNMIGNNIQQGHKIAGDYVFATNSIAMLPGNGSIQSDKIKASTPGGNITIDSDVHLQLHNLIVNDLKINSANKKLTISDNQQTGTVYDTVFNPIPQIDNPIPIGTIIMYPSTTPPSNEWLVCDGSAARKTTYPLLFSVLNNTYGNGSTLFFALPDFRHRFAQGGITQNNNSGGSNLGLLDLKALPNHEHEFLACRDREYSLPIPSYQTNSNWTARQESIGQTSAEILQDDGNSWKYNSSYKIKVLASGNFLTLQLSVFETGQNISPSQVAPTLATPHNFMINDLVYVDCNFMRPVNGQGGSKPQYPLGLFARVEAYSSYILNPMNDVIGVYILDKNNLIFQFAIADGAANININVPQYFVNPQGFVTASDSYDSVAPPRLWIDGRSILQPQSYYFNPSYLDVRGYMLPRPFNFVPPYTNVNFLIKAASSPISTGQYDDFPFDPNRVLTAWKFNLPSMFTTNNIMYDNEEPNRVVPLISNISNLYSDFDIEFDYLADENGYYILDDNYLPFRVALQYNVEIDKYEFIFRDNKYFVTTLFTNTLNLSLFRKPEMNDSVGDQWINDWVVNDSGVSVPTYTYDAQLIGTTAPPRPPPRNSDGFDDDGEYWVIGYSVTDYDFIEIKTYSPIWNEKPLEPLPIPNDGIDTIAVLPFWIDGYEIVGQHLVPLWTFTPRYVGVEQPSPREPNLLMLGHNRWTMFFYMFRGDILPLNTNIEQYGEMPNNTNYYATLASRYREPNGLVLFEDVEDLTENASVLRTKIFNFDENLLSMSPYFILYYMPNGQAFVTFSIEYGQLTDPPFITSNALI